MKRTNAVLFLLSLFVVTFISPSCRKNKSSYPIDQLPPETQTGANTFGCLINGKAFIPAGSGLAGPNLFGIYQYIDNTDPYGYVFAISGTNKKNPENITGVAFAVDSIEIKAGIYPLRLRKNGQGVGQYRIDQRNGEFSQYYTNELVTGILAVKKFDLTTQIVSGTFWFNAVNDKGDTVKITDGRFDVRFTR